jgi:hypothetical protein
MDLCPTCRHDLQALVEERRGIAEILAKCAQRDAILDGQQAHT